MDVTCKQRKLTPTNTWSSPYLGILCILMLWPVSPKLVMSPDLEIRISLDFLISHKWNTHEMWNTIIDWKTMISEMISIIFCFFKMHLMKNSTETRIVSHVVSWPMARSTTDCMPQIKSCSLRTTYSHCLLRIAKALSRNQSFSSYRFAF